MFLSVGGVQDQSIWNKLEMRHSIPDLVIPNSNSPSRSKSLTGTRRKSTTSSKNIKTYLKRGSSLDTSTTVQYNAKTQHTKFIKSNRRHNVAFTKENSVNKHEEDEWQCTNRMMESITESKLETGSSSMYAEELTSSSSSELL